MRAVQFSEFGGPEVLQVVELPEPHPEPSQIRVVVNACGVNPVDWKIREGMMGGELPRRIGSEVAGVVDEVGDDVTDVTAGDRVFGPTSGGAADFAILSHWAHVPATLDDAGAAALPVAVETAVRGLDLLGVAAGETLLINGGAGAVGTVATQLAVDRGARVIATASERNAERLRAYGAEVTPYGDGLAERVQALAPDGVDRVFDMGPGGALPELVAIAAGDPERVLTISDFAGAAETGVRASGGADSVRRWDALDHAATLVEQGRLSLPVERTFPLEDVAEAQRVSQAGHVSGKLVLIV
ncbi:MAG TPA: NADP-dependent oxidoreductase [Solirubrobacteraceae bacterium]|nr:NADP-dependent oxidoreductase [Solirubrobacteraceae bacterium]